MKRTLKRALLLILVIANIFSLFAVFSFADEEGEATEESKVVVMTNRSFDEGWDINNGLSYVEPKSQKFAIDYVQTPDFDYNYFLRFLKQSDNELNYNGYLQFYFSQIKEGTIAVAMDFNIDGYSSMGGLGYIMTTSAAATRVLAPTYRITNNKLLVGNGGNYITAGDFKDGWIRTTALYFLDQSLRFCNSCGTHYDLDKSEDGKCSCGKVSDRSVILVKTYFGPQECFDTEKAIDYKSVSSSELDLSSNTYYKTEYIFPKDGQRASMYVFRFGLSDNQPDTVGHSCLIDNLAVYYGENITDENGYGKMMDPIPDIYDKEKYGLGTLINENVAKTIPILTGDTVTVDHIKDSVIMKTGSDYMLYGGAQRNPIFENNSGEAYGAPFKKDGVVYVPFEPFLKVTKYPIFVRGDGISYDISTETGTSSITLDRDTAVINGKRVALKHPPLLAKDPDNSENTYPVISKDDIEAIFPGFYVTYDDMGFILFSRGKDVLNRAHDLKKMVELTEDVIYGFDGEDELYEKLKAGTNNFDHPYLIVTDEKISYMQGVYGGTIEDLYYKKFLDAQLELADGYFERFTTLTDNPANPTYFTKACEQKPEKYKHLAHELTNPFTGIKEGEAWTDSAEFTYHKAPDENGYIYQSVLWDEDNGPHFNDGYDYAGSRNSEGVNYTQYILDLACAYLITDDMKYAELAYDMLVSLCDENNWHNWSHKHFLSVGEMMTRLGLAYDWLYDAWAEIQNERAPEYSLSVLTQTICDRAYFYGYELSKYSRTSNVWTRDSYGATTGQWNWSVDTINWNCVCNCGLVMGAMAISGEEERLCLDYIHDEDGCNMVKWTLCNNMWRIAEYGLLQYAPDGSYVESSGYWAYATNYLAEMIAAMRTAYGDDLGFLETPGIDKTFYYAVQVEFPAYNDAGELSYNLWGYNDGGCWAEQGTKIFYYGADFFGDNALAAIRNDGIKHNKPISWDDIVGYKPEYSGLDMSEVEMSLDFELHNLEGIVARSTWEEETCIYTGVMGNHNNAVQHDQVDSGNFIYASQGFLWISDPGADNYNVYDYWGNGVREFYYRNSAEGHNLVLITDSSMPYGQSLSGGGVLSKYVDGGESGMYAVIDNRGAYGDITNFANRGLLFANNRETVVVQDEIAFKGVQSCAWVAHTTAHITLSTDGRTAYFSTLINGYSKYIRLTLLSDNPHLKFDIMTCGMGEHDFLLEGTHRPGWSESMGGLREYSRAAFKRLVVRADNVLALNMAVVIEQVEATNSKAPIMYEYTNINKWDPKREYEGFRFDSDIDENIVTNSKLTDIKTYGTQAGSLLEDNLAFTTRLKSFYTALVRVNAAVSTFRPESFKNIPAINSVYLEYLKYLDRYNAYRKEINSLLGGSQSLSYGLTLFS